MASYRYLYCYIRGIMGDMFETMGDMAGTFSNSPIFLLSFLVLLNSRGPT